jgi:RimJ/RimL family protein N-acetyltransferase
MTFLPIDFARHAELCVRFCEDSWVCSFGDATRFRETLGAERYLQWLAERLAQLPASCVHGWENDRIVAQIELGKYRADPSIGYVTRFYLVPEMRNQGLGAELDEYARQFFAQMGFSRARLSVSPTNLQAWRFYAKSGWVDVGPRQEMPEVHLLEKQY